MRSKLLLVSAILTLIPLAFIANHLQKTPDVIYTDKVVSPSPGPITYQATPAVPDVPPKTKITKPKRVATKTKRSRANDEPLAGMRQQRREEAKQTRSPYAAQQLGMPAVQPRGDVYDPMAKRWVPGLSGPQVRVQMNKAARQPVPCQDESCVVKGEDGVSVAGVVMNTHKRRLPTDPGLMEGRVERGNGVVTPAVYVK